MGVLVGDWILPQVPLHPFGRRNWAGLPVALLHLGAPGRR